MKRFNAFLSLLLACTMMPLTAAAEYPYSCEEPVPYPIEYPDPTGSIFSSETMAIQPGDLDGDGTLSVSDLARMQRFLLGKETLDSTAFLAADCNHDGEIDIYDLALFKAAMLSGKQAASWQVSCDVLDVRWTNSQICDDDRTDSIFAEKLFDKAADFSAWLDGQAELSPKAKAAYQERYSASFFETQTLMVSTLPQTAAEPGYQVRGIRENGDALEILLDGAGAHFNPYEVRTVQRIAVGLPRSLTDGKTVRCMPCGNIWNLMDLLLHDTGESYRYSSESYTSPDGSFTLHAKHAANPWFKEDNELEFSWKEEGEILSLGSYSTTMQSMDALMPEWGKTGVTLHFPDKTGTEQAVTFPYPDRTVTRQSAVFPIDEKRAPEIDSVTVQADCWGTLSRKCEIQSAYGNVLSRGVVGRVGVPIKFSTSGTVTNPEITIHYDASELRGIPETNLIVLHEGETYTTVSSVTDTEADTVTFIPQDEGTYILADAYTWYGRWSGDVSKYAYTYNKAEYPSDWERNGETGCIMELADKDWAMRNSPDFHVATPEELASAVWYVNAMADNRMCSVTLDADIDLAGLDWTPLGWGDSEFGSIYTATWFQGTIDGQGHTIRNLHVMDGFIQCSQNLTVKDITFENAVINGKSSTGIVCGQALYTTELINVHATGEIRIGSVSTSKYGALIGSGGNVFFSECTADVTVNGQPCPYLSAEKRAAAETAVEHPVTLTLNDDYTVTRGETEYQKLGWTIYRDGKQVLVRSADNETTLDIAKIISFRGEPLAVAGSEYSIYLTAWISGNYVPVSNTVTFRYEPVETE